MMVSVLTFGHSVYVYVEIVKDATAIARGLAGYAYLAADYGMLFDMGYEDDHHFWMHGVRFPLDIVFLDPSMTVVGVLADVPAMNDVFRHVGKPSRYVLEVNANWAETNGIIVGSKGVLH